MPSPSTTNTKLAVIQNDIGYIKERINAIDEKVSDNYVSKTEFDPIKKIVYGMVGLFLTGVVGAVLSLVINR